MNAVIGLSPVASFHQSAQLAPARYAINVASARSWVQRGRGIVSEFRILSQPKEKSADAQDAHSKQVIIAGQGPAVIALFAIAAKVPSAALAHPLGCFRAGPSPTIAASLLRRHCWRMLGASFTAAVAVRPEHSAFERGAYRYVRHPSYRAGIVMFLGVGLALRNWITLAVLLAPLPLVAVEERALAAVIRVPYQRRMRRTKRFVPFLF